MTTTTTTMKHKLASLALRGIADAFNDHRFSPPSFIELMASDDMLCEYDVCDTDGNVLFRVVVEADNDPYIRLTLMIPVDPDEREWEVIAAREDHIDRLFATLDFCRSCGEQTAVATDGFCCDSCREVGE